MVGSFLPHQPILKHLTALPLDQFLKGGLVVQGLGQPGNLPAEDKLLDKFPGGPDAAVQIDCGQNSLYSIGLDGGTLPTSAGVLPLAQTKIFSQIQFSGDFH